MGLAHQARLCLLVPDGSPEARNSLIVQRAVVGVREQRSPAQSHTAAGGEAGTLSPGRWCTDSTPLNGGACVASESRRWGLIPGKGLMTLLCPGVGL